MTIKQKELEQQLLLSNMGAVVVQALKFKPNSLYDKEDYIQEGLIALLKSIRGYDPNKGAKLNTYAWKAISRAIARSIKTFKNKEIHKDLSFIEQKECERLGDFLPALTDEELQIITLKALGYTLEDIGKTLHKSKQKIHCTLEKILEKIKQANE